MKSIRLLMLIVLSFCFLNCQEQNENSSSSPSKQAEKEQKLSETPLDADIHTATHLDGKKYSSAEDAGKRLVVAFFDFRNAAAQPLLKTLEKMQHFEQEYNFKIIGVSLNGDKKDDLKDFLKKNEIRIPIVMDSPDLKWAMDFKIPKEVTLTGTDAKHQPSFGLLADQLVEHPEFEDEFLRILKENLGIQIFSKDSAIPKFGLKPKMPHFEFQDIKGTSYSTNSFKNKVLLVMFFSPRCPHCQREIQFLKNKIYPELHKLGLEVLAISVLKVEDADLDLIKKLDMPWIVTDGSDRKIKNNFSDAMSIPENFFVGKDGLIHFYSSGFSPFHENVTLMRIKALLGIENPPLLSEKQFNGSDSCMTCHPGEYASWSITPHAHSFQTLVVKGHENDVECIGCHSLGFKDPRGYPVREDPKTKKQIAVVPEPFQNVQCEHCHGIGGPHVKDAIVYKAADMEKMCLECHTEKFSLHFNFAERIKKTDHSDMQTILDMTPEQRIALLKKVSKSPDDLFGSHVKYVGSDSCLSCHANEHAAWKNSTHGKKTDVKWETTAFQENLTRENNAASCESCHGPGEKHVKSKKQADIRGLGDDCPFCVVEQICLSCHSAQKGFNTQTAVEKIKGHK